MPVIHLGHMFYIHGPSFHYEKVVAATCELGQPLAVLTYDDSDRMLKIFRCEGDSWTSIPTMPTRSSWGDTCLFKGQPCVADNDGRTLMIGPEDSSVMLLANPVFGGHIKFLVESECDLLLLDCYGIDGSDYDEN
ncbi:F-box protein, partial [Trifolium medium]|nr:F-box protein [Trifolium medium]